MAADLGELDPEQLLELEEKGGGDEGADDKSGEQDTGDAGAEDQKEADKAKEGDAKADDSESKTPEPKTEPEEKPKSELQRLADELKAKNDALEDPLKGLEDDWEPKSYKELLEIQQKVADKRFAELELAKTEQALSESRKEEESREAIKKEWDAEISSLIGDGRLPKIKDENSEEDEGVKARNEVFRYMIDHNLEVGKTGKGYRIHSFANALDMMELEKLQKEKTEFDKKQQSLNSKKGSLIGGNSVNTASAKAGSGYVAGQSLDDIMSEVLSE